VVQPFDVAWQRTDGLDAVHELADGRLVATERDCHPDSIAEAFRGRITPWRPKLTTRFSTKAP
jgi:hypothetical protein